MDAVTGPRCAACGRESPPAARFCLACGARLEAAATQPQERKVVSVLFVDLVGFTERAEALDPEEVGALLAPYWEHVREVLERHTGTVEKYVGDAVVAVFGAPAAHEDDPERAVRAALALRDWARAAADVDLRLAVATGDALVRVASQPLTGENIAVSDIVNTAARLQQAAPVNGVLVDERTHAASSDAIAYRAAPPVHAKGKSAPVAAWEAVELHAHADDLAAHELTPFVARETELAILAGVYARVAAHRSPELLTIVGPPGIGKSRLVHELARRLEAGGNGPRWLRGRAQPYGETAAFGALRELFQAWVDGRPVETAVAAVVPDRGEAAWVASHVSRLLGGEGDGASDAADAFAAWRRLVAAVAGERPLALVLEDLQWADDALLDFVADLFEWLVESPVLVVCTARPELLERRSSWGGGAANALTLSLTALDDAETAALLEAALGRPPAPAELPRLLEHAGGNPLCAEQCARVLRERGSCPDAAVPESVQALIAARLDLLPGPEKSLLQDAAVAGAAFTAEAVRAVAERPPPDLAGCLHALVRKQFLRRSDGRYAFAHALVREVAYGQLTRTARAAKHARAAAWLESRGAPDGDTEGVAQHYLRALELTSGEERARLAGPAAAALATSAERALRLNAFATAGRLFAQSLELMAPGDERRPRTLLAYGRALWAAESGGDDVLDEARRSLLDGGDRAGAAEAEAALSELYWFRGDRRRSTAHLEAAADLVRDDPPSPAKARVLARLARHLMLAARDGEAIETGRAALALGEELRLDDVRADALNSIGSSRARAGDPAGIRDVERAVAIAVPANLRAAVPALNNLASLHAESGDLRRSSGLLVESLETARRLGDRTYVDWARAALVSVAVSDGRWDEARTEAEALLAASERRGGHYLDAVLRYQLAEIQLARGETEEALEQVARAETEARRADDPQVLLAALAGCAFVDWALGREDAARTYVDEILERCRHATFLPPSSTFALALTLTELGRGDTFAALARREAYPNRWFEAAVAYTRGELDRAAELYGEIGALPVEAYVRLRSAERYAAAGLPDDAARVAAPAREFFVRAGAPFWLDRLAAAERSARLTTSARRS